MPRTEWGWMVTREELECWILVESPELLVVNKPGHVLCHPSKYGPWSSLVGAARAYLGDAVLHMPSRLDRETSGVVVLARGRKFGSALQRAIEKRRVRKSYTAILDGLLDAPVTVDAPIGKAEGSIVLVKRGVREGGLAARTEFTPIEQRGGRTLVRVEPHTGRLHQIRVHAASIGHPVMSDKIYGADETLFLEFIAEGMTERLRRALPLDRQALHASGITFELPERTLRFEAPLAADMAAFWNAVLQ